MILENIMIISYGERGHGTLVPDGSFLGSLIHIISCNTGRLLQRTCYIIYLLYMGIYMYCTEPYLKYYHTAYKTEDSFKKKTRMLRVEDRKTIYGEKMEIKY